MNHNQFIQMVKGLTKEQLATSGLKSPSQVIAVCLVLATYGDYETGTKIKPAWVTIAKEAHVSRTTAHKVRDWLVHNSVIEAAGKTAPVNGKPGNITIYRFGSVVQRTWTTVKADKEPQLSNSEEQLSISEPQLSNWEPQLSIVGGHNTTLDTTSNTKEDTTKTDAPALADAPTVTFNKEEPKIKGKKVYTFFSSESDSSFNYKAQARVSVRKSGTSVDETGEAAAQQIEEEFEEGKRCLSRLLTKNGVSSEAQFRAKKIYRDRDWLPGTPGGAWRAAEAYRKAIPMVGAL